MASEMAELTPFGVPSRDTTFKTVEDAQSELNEFAFPRGYTLIRKTRRKDKSGEVATVVLMCDRSGKYKLTKESYSEYGTTRVNTKKTDCRMIVGLKKKGELWHLDYKDENLEHNHEPRDDLSVGTQNTPIWSAASESTEIAPFGVPRYGVMFKSLEDALLELNQFALPRGYALIRVTCKKGASGELTRVMLMCDRSGKYKSTKGCYSKSGKTRNSSSKKTDCKMSVRLEKKGDLWRLVYNPENLKHNHEPSEDPSFHTIHRKNERTLAVMKTIDFDTKNGISTAQTLERLGEAQGAKLQRRYDVNNAKARLKRAKIDHQTHSQ